MTTGKAFANRWRDSWVRFTRPQETKTDESRGVLDNSDLPPVGLEFLTASWNGDQRFHLVVPPQLKFLKKQLSDQDRSISPRHYTTPTGTYPVFEGNEVAIFLDWYNHLHGTDQQSVDHFLSALHVWAGEERRWSERERRQLPYFLAAACGESLQHEYYEELHILVATNRMRDGCMKPEFSPNFKKILSQRFELSFPEPKSAEDYANLLPGLDTHFLRSLYSISLTAPNEGTPLHLIVAGLESTAGLNTHIIPKHAVIYRNGSTSGYDSL